MVLRVDKDQVPYIEATYETEHYARLRQKHLKDLDGVDAAVQQVSPPYLWRPPDEPKREPFIPPAVLGAVTVGRGSELHDYARGERRTLSLGGAIEAAWTSWRGQQAAQGKLEEAAQEPPPIPPELFEEHGGTLKLHPQGLP